MKEYIKARGRLPAGGAAFLLFLLFYFGYLCGVPQADLVYFEVLCATGAAILLWADVRAFRKRRKEEEARRQQEEAWENGLEEIKREQREAQDYLTRWIHEVKVPLAALKLQTERCPDREMGGQMKDSIEKISGLLRTMLLYSKTGQMENDVEEIKREQREAQDYLTRWIHEVKVPLAALKLQTERCPDREMGGQMKDSIEKISGLLRTMLLYSKTGQMENDVEFEKVFLKAAAKEAVKNHSWFLIREHFQIKMEDLGECAVYTDRRWLVYILDQILGNAVKYCRDNPEIIFGAEQVSPQRVRFWIEDNGTGVAQEELPWIFDRGYTGGQSREGDFRSTGMGLYLADRVARRLGIRLEALSEEGKWTRIVLTFEQNITEMLDGM